MIYWTSREFRQCPCSSSCACSPPPPRPAPRRCRFPACASRSKSCATAGACPTSTRPTPHDLFFAQGYMAARDRLWQIDLWRRDGHRQAGRDPRARGHRARPPGPRRPLPRRSGSGVAQLRPRHEGHRHRLHQRHQRLHPRARRTSGRWNFSIGGLRSGPVGARRLPGARGRPADDAQSHARSRRASRNIRRFGVAAVAKFQPPDPVVPIEIPHGPRSRRYRRRNRARLQPGDRPCAPASRAATTGWWTAR